MRGLGVMFAVLALSAGAAAHDAAAAPPAVAATAAPAAGVAPLHVRLAAAGDPASYVWDLGDGTTAEGPTVTHVYGPGRHLATVTATNELGETSQAQVLVTAAERALSLEAPGSAGYGRPAVLAGALRPAPAGTRVQIYRGRTHVTTAITGGSGRFRAVIRATAPGPYVARFAGLASAPRTIVLRPVLTTSVPETIPLLEPTVARASLAPAAAGSVRIRVLHGSRVLAAKRASGSVAVSVPTRAERTLRVVVETEPRPGFARVRRVTATRVVLPTLGPGSRGAAVLALERRLAELRYALRAVDTSYGSDTVEAVLAFQKVHGLARTGRADRSLWRRLATAGVPRPRQGGSAHLEVDKGRNVLYEVVGGRVERIVHVSTGLTGNTPIGTFHVYRKVVGWDWVLWYPMYFLRGFAVHGYPSVPAYPASHGCVRVPMWLAPSLFSRYGHGTRIVVFA